MIAFTFTVTIAVESPAGVREVGAGTIRLMGEDLLEELTESLAAAGDVRSIECTDAEEVSS